LQWDALPLFDLSKKVVNKNQMTMLDKIIYQKEVAKDRISHL
jgi:hypothetical protein